MKFRKPRYWAAATAALALALLGVSACDHDGDKGVAPTDQLTISATTASPGDPITLTWTSSSNVVSCNAAGTDTTNWGGVVLVRGTKTFPAPAAGTYTYTLNCYSTTNVAGAVAVSTVMLTVGGGGGVAGVTPAGQSLAGIDPVFHTVWVPTYTLDGSGNLQLVVVAQSDVAPAAPAVAGPRAAVRPRATGTGQRISLPMCDTPIALAYDTNTQNFLIECANSQLDTANVFVQVVKTASLADLAHPTVATIPTGLNWGGSWGGILFNPNTNKAVVAGSFDLGLLDVPTDGAPTFDTNSVVELSNNTDSLSLNFATQLLLVCGDGPCVTIDTSVQPLLPVSLTGPTGVTDGNAFDSLTNIAVITPEVDASMTGNIAEVFNFTGAFDAAGGTPPASLTMLQVQGLGFITPLGEGPGGQATMNVVTHQALVADEFGPNFWLVQLPTAPVTGAINNKGQPGSGTTADASSAYAVSAGLIPNVTINDVSTPLGIRGDPAALGIDQQHNIAYMLADTDVFFHSWAGNTTVPLFLVAVDLSNAPVGGCAAGITVDGTQGGTVSTGCTTTWTPAVAALPLN